jgi:hypothetical protein
MTPAETGTRFAAALDADDFDAVRWVLAAGCRYEIRGTVLVGPDAILESYRSASEGAKQEFDSVRYESLVVAFGAGTVTVEFADHVERNGKAHTFRCRQRLTLDADGRVVGIVHEDLPGERERLTEFRQSS